MLNHHGVMMSTKKRRVQMDVTERTWEVLTSLSGQLGLPKTGVLRRGIQLLQLLQPRLDEGATLIVEHPDGRRERIVML